MESCESTFSHIGQGLLDLEINQRYLTLKKYTIRPNVFNNVSFMVNDNYSFSYFNSTFPTDFGKLEIELDGDQKRLSFSPKNLLLGENPVFTLNNYGTNPQKRWVFSAQIPFSFKNLRVIVNGMKTKKEISTFADVIFPYEFKNMKFGSHILLCAQKELLSALFKINHPLFGVCTSLNANRSIIHCQLNDRTGLINIFNEYVLTTQKNVSHYLVGGLFDHSRVKLGYLFDSKRSTHKGRLYVDFNELKFGCNITKSHKKYDFHYGVAVELNQQSFAMRFGKDHKLILNMSTQLVDIGSASFTVGIDNINMNKWKYGFSILLTE